MLLYKNCLSLIHIVLGKKRLVAAAYRTMINGEQLFIQAPTGIGKTLSTVFPAVWAVGEEYADKIFI